MCAVVAYNYCNMEWHIKVGGTSAPVEIAYLYSIPFLIGIVLYLIGVFYLKKITLIYVMYNHKEM